MATIEPRLMHLLNDSKSTHSPPLDLPPIQNFSYAGSAHSLSLPPLGLDATPRGDPSASKPQLAPKQIPSLFELTGDDGAARQAPFKEGAYGDDGPARPKKPSHSLSLLLDDPPDTSHSLRMILDDAPEFVDDLSTKKRHRALTAKEELIQLPQPLKKQKSSQQVIPLQQVVPPIINGLHEPPPNAAVFPPISSAEFDDNEALNRTALIDYAAGSFDGHATGAPTDGDKTAGAKLKRRATKPRRKWTEEETNHLLLGVSRHGVGKWTTILDDRDFKFNDRNAGDLKDRFRTCCPDELRGKLAKKGSLSEKPPPRAREPRLRTKTSLPLENILIDSDEPERDKQASSSQQDSDSAPKQKLQLQQEEQQEQQQQQQKKSRAHRKKMEDLAELGIHGPFKKSHRRERRPFTERDDKEILDGLHSYGPAWTKIQRDPRFNLASRQPTDLRDRVRNKYPDIFNRIEKGSFQTKEPGRNNGLLEPSVNTTIENSLTSAKSGTLEPSLNRTSSKEDMPRWPLPSSLLEASDNMASHGFDMNEHTATALLGSVGEMDISRLLLDDSQLATDP